MTSVARFKLTLWAVFLVGTWATVITLLALFAEPVSHALSCLTHGAPADWVALAGLLVAFYFLDYLRFSMFLGVFGAKAPVRLWFTLPAVSYSVSSVTPWMELHLPAMIHLLTRAGIPAETARLATKAKSFYTDLSILLLTLVAIALQRREDLPPLFGDHLGLWAAFTASLAALLVTVLVFASPLSRRLGARAALAPEDSVRRSILAGLASIARDLGPVAADRSRYKLGAHAATLVWVLVYVAIGTMLARIVGLPLSLHHALGAFCGSLLCAYLAPVPGSVAAAELFTAWLLDRDLGAQALAVGLALRALTWHVVILPGAYLLWRSMRGWRLRDSARLLLRY